MYRYTYDDDGEPVRRTVSSGKSERERFKDFLEEEFAAMGLPKDPEKRQELIAFAKFWRKWLPIAGGLVLSLVVGNTYNTWSDTTKRNIINKYQEENHGR